jgi:hypothetical protein
MHSDAGDTTQLVPGYPIRTPWDHSSVDSSPRPIAASHVLHRLLVPRHPPSALDNLTTKMLASTMQISTNNQPTTPHPNTSHHKPTVHDRYIGTGHAWQHSPKETKPHPQVTACSLRTQQGVHTIPNQPHQPQHSSTPPPGSSTKQGWPLPAENVRQCLRQQAPRPDIRGPRAPYRHYSEWCSLERR